MFLSVWGSLHKCKLSLPEVNSPCEGALHQSLPTFLSFYSFLNALNTPSPPPLPPTQQLIPASALWKKIGNVLIYHPEMMTYCSGFWPPLTQIFLVSWLAGNCVFCSTCWTLFIGNYSESHCLNISALGVDFCCQKQQLFKSATYC